uniref:Putative intron-encoded protein n=1 Tax=Chaetosphaeridium globosum TaxID=96477 RepID=Q8MA17_CHAGL|nr:putative intron-encoded protein [Chaetosphaeridium globosum]AAM96587.1 putative intron-encoded protein [Chaetosphaeridium globosum]
MLRAISNDDKLTWKKINWKKIENNLFKIQTRIYKAKLKQKIKLKQNLEKMLSKNFELRLKIIQLIFLNSKDYIKNQFFEEITKEFLIKIIHSPSWETQKILENNINQINILRNKKDDYNNLNYNNLILKKDNFFIKILFSFFIKKQNFINSYIFWFINTKFEKDKLLVFLTNQQFYSFYKEKNKPKQIKNYNLVKNSINLIKKDIYIKENQNKFQKYILITKTDRYKKFINSKMIAKKINKFLTKNF